MQILESRICGLVINLEHMNGTYQFPDCSHYAPLWAADREMPVSMPVTLEVDFSSAEKVYVDVGDT